MQRNITRALLALILVTFLGVFLVVCVAGGGLYLWARQGDLDPITAVRLKIRLTRYEDTLQSSAGDDPSYREFEVQFGDTPQTISTNLLLAGLITDPGLFVDYVRYYGLDQELQAGTYFLQQTQTMEEIAYALRDASAASIPFKTIGGWRIEEIAEIAVSGNTLLDFNGNDFLALVQRGATMPPEFKQRNGIPNLMSNGEPPSLEGFLFPADYKLQPNATALDLRDELLAAFGENVTEDMYNKAAAQGLTMYQVVTLASIVQREVQVQEEAPIVASVYLNRLRLPMKLDADPTVQYAIGTTRDGRWWPNISVDDYYGLAGLPNQSYSTYLNDGLPPGPICSPTLATIRAVLDAPPTEYFYFRLSCDGQTHAFFTLEQQADHANYTCP